MKDEQKTLLEHLQTLCDSTAGASLEERESAYHQLRPHILRAVRSQLHLRMRQHVDSTDIEQSCWTAFLRMSTSRLAFDDEGHLLAYIWRMTRNRIIDRSRRLKGDLNHRAEFHEDVAEHELQSSDRDEDTPSQQIRNLVTHADSQVRNVVELRLQNLSPDEIAGRLGVHRSTVYRILTRLARTHTRRRAE